MTMRLLRVLPGVLAAVLLFPIAAAAAPTIINEVSGVVTNNGQSVAGAHVTVVCDNNTRQATTGDAGAYRVQYSGSECKSGSVAQVTATYGGHSGTNSGEVKADGLALTDSLDRTGVPGFGVVTGFVVALLGGAGYLGMRGREANGRKA